MTLSPFPIQHNIDFISSEFSAQRGVKSPDVAAAILVYLQSSNMECLLALLVQFVVINNGVLGGYDLRHRVGEIDPLVKPDITFHNSDLTVALHQDQITWMNRYRFLR